MSDAHVLANPLPQAASDKPPHQRAPPGKIPVKRHRFKKPPPIGMLSRIPCAKCGKPLRTRWNLYHVHNIHKQRGKREYFVCRLCFQHRTEPGEDVEPVFQTPLFPSGRRPAWQQRAQDSNNNSNSNSNSNRNKSTPGRQKK